jgi:hypothetical protein
VPITDGSVRSNSSGLLIVGLAALILVGMSCSSKSGNQKSQGKEAGLAFTASVSDLTRPWGKEAAGTFFDKIAQDPPSTFDVKAFNERVSLELCQKVRAFKPDLDSTGDLDSRSDAVSFAKQSAVDSAVAGLLEYSFAGDVSQRDQRLATLKIGNGLSGNVPAIESLTGAGILDASSKLTVPPTELITSGPEEPYEKYRNWLTKDSPTLLDKATALTAGIGSALDACETQK